MGRPLDASDYQKLARHGVSTVYDAAGRVGLVDVELKQIIPNSSVCGPARTLELGPLGNRGVHEVMKSIIPGEVLVIATLRPEPIALVGELLAFQARRAGAAGILVDGAIRDVDAIVRLGLPVWSRWIRAKSAAKSEKSRLQVTVNIGGTEIAPGDAVILDADGAVIVPDHQVHYVVQKADQREATELATRAGLEEGQFTYDLYGLASFADREFEELKAASRSQS